MFNIAKHNPGELVKVTDGIGKPIEFVVTDNNCWVCVSHARTHRGYPVLYRNGKSYRMHRYFYESSRGNIPEGKFLLHDCDNPKCINPDHMTIGTHKDNMDDMVKKGRQPVGIKNGRAKLTEKDVLDILNDTSPRTVIASKYNISCRTVRDIKDRKVWRHITCVE